MRDEEEYAGCGGGRDGGEGAGVLGECAGCCWWGRHVVMRGAVEEVLVWVCTVRLD